VSPPLGCRFHPRCPRAFEICGWESRDLKDLLEARWASMTEEDYETERAIVGNLDALEVAALEAVVPAARGQSAEAVLALLLRTRDTDPNEPLWRGVSGMTTEGDHVRVLFRNPMEPRLEPVGNVEVACHLFTEPAPELSVPGP
jgi:peptide/nickel transport system ATP-binding protein